MNNASSSPSSVISGVARNIETIMQIEQEFLRRRSRVHRLSGAIARLAGSIGFVIAHVIGLTVWIVVNEGIVRGFTPFDPYPFSFLALIVTIEVVFLSTFVLMTQNCQNNQADQRAHLHLQIGLLAEQETTKILQILEKICRQLGIETAIRDRELKEMVAETKVGVLAHELAQNLQKTREDDPGK